MLRHDRPASRRMRDRHVVVTGLHLPKPGAAPTSSSEGKRDQRRCPMLNEVGVVAVVVAALAAGASPAAAQAGAASHGRLTPAAASALAPDPDGTADGTAPALRPC